MYDGAKIMGGLIVFLALVSAPFWYTSAEGKAYRPDPKVTTDAKSCIESKEYMQAWHMDVLDTWRDSVVRDSNRIYVAKDGKKHNMSLSNNCMKCHTDKEKFCDECHNYLGVSPYCWDCHIEPKKE